ncbi:resolvase [alpha proteobacterium BAL199]|nr:resolvase [alpha proteobacterium BAL199]
MSLLIEALARALGDGEPVDGFSSAKLRHYYLSNPLESGDRYFKLLLSQTDNVSLKAVIKNTEQPNEPSLRVTQNFDLFTELLAEQKGDLAPVCRGLAKLVVVDIALSRDQDIREPYDDGGFSGGTLERPGLKRLIQDVEAGLIDVIVVYKIDRLSRSLMDFARLVEIFDRNQVTFVSVTQSFNTTTSMGRLTLNILLSFAQFEREVIGERIRDKVAASRKRGMWMGG